MRTKGFVHLFLAAVLWTAASVGTSEACNGVPVTSQPITTCGTTCYADCYLANDITCTNGQGITLNAGWDLDLCGHAITCTSPTCVTAPAVLMLGNNSKVSSTINYGKIDGGWGPAVNCAGRTQSQVTGIKFETTFGYSAYNCAKVEGNTFAFGSKVGAIVGIANTDRIGDNYFDVGYASITYSGNKNISIDHNFFLETDPMPPHTGTIIDVHSATHAVTVENNIIIAHQQPIKPEVLNGSTYDNNLCDTLDTDCQSCIASGVCESPQPTFTMP